MKNQSASHILIISIVLLLLLLGGYVFLYMQVNKNNKSATKLSADLSYEVSRGSRIQSLEELVRGIESERELLASQLLKNEDVVSFITMIEALGQYTPATIEISTVSDPTRVLTIKVSVEGQWNEVQHVLQMLEVLPYSTMITDLTLTSKNSLGEWNASVEIETLMANSK